MALLPGVTGAYGRQGGGALLLTAASCELDYDFVRKPSGPPQTRTVNHLRLGEALLELEDPPIRALFIAANNPAVTCPDAGKVRRGLAREDLFTVVHDPFLSATARYADIVLPAATYLETEDLYRAYGTYYLQYAPQAVTPQGEAWPNFRLAQALARRMGLDDPVFCMPVAEIAAAMLQGCSRQHRRARSRTRPHRRADLARARGPAAVPHTLRQARILLRTDGGAGPPADARLEARSRGGAAGRALAATTADRARVFPEPHCLLGRRLSATA